MNYQIFKYLNPEDLLNVRETKLGGYQLTSNTLLRSRIKNYLDKLGPKDLLELFNKEQETERIKLYLQQIGLEILEFENIGIKYNQIVNIAKIMEVFPQLLGLRLKKTNMGDVEYNLFGEESLNVLVDSLKYTKNLQILDLYKLAENNISGHSIQSLALNLGYIPLLQIFHLHENQIGPKSMNVLARNFKLIPNLRILTLDKNRIGDGAEAIALNVKYIPKLEILGLGGNLIGDQAVKLLAENFHFIKDIQTLVLMGSQIGNISALSNNLCFISKLRLLNLNLNSIDGYGSLELFSNLQTIPDLQRLLLNNNKLGNIGVEALAANFKYIPNLEYLSLGSNMIADPASLILCRKLTLMKLLKMVDLRDNLITDVTTTTLINIAVQQEIELYI